MKRRPTVYIVASVLLLGAFATGTHSLFSKNAQYTNAAMPQTQSSVIQPLSYAPSAPVQAAAAPTAPADPSEGNIGAEHAQASKTASIVPLPAPALRKSAASTANPDPANVPVSPILAFPVLSDIHIQAWHKPSHRKLAAALADLHAINPKADALVFNGDLGNGRPADYAKLQSLLREAPLPEKVFFTIGNHEYNKAWFNSRGEWDETNFPNGDTEQAAIARFLQFTGSNRLYSQQTVNGYSFLFLGSEQYRQSAPANLEDAYLSQAQLDWLKDTLRLRHEADPTKPIFVFLHQPLPYTVSGTSFCCTNNRAIIQHEALKAILSAYPQVVLFSGHTHWELKLPTTLVQDGFTMVNSSAVIGTLTDNGQGSERENGPDESEGLYVEVYVDRIEIRGRDFYRKRWIPEAQYSLPLWTSDPSASAQDSRAH